MKKLIFIFILTISTQISFAQDFDFIVAQNGSGDFEKVQDAIMAVPDFRNVPTYILIKSGKYKEKIVLPVSKRFVVLVGENVDETILTYDDFSSKYNRFGEEMGTTGSSSFFVFGDDFAAKNLTFENSSGPVGQAVAMRVTGDRAFFENCKFLGYQDTLYTQGEKSRQFYKDCYIEGTTDFIFGASTAVFENCEIYSKTGGQYITAASTIETVPFGYVFINCKLTGDAPEESVYLGRPWRIFAKTVFINTEMGSHIHPKGWHNWNKEEAEKTAFYAEYGSFGEGSSVEDRASWSKQISKESIQDFSKESILAGADDWVPGKNLNKNLWQAKLQVTNEN